MSTPTTPPVRVTSLRRRLLVWILGPLTALIGVNAWVAYGNAVQAANEAYDRSLYLAARTLAEETTWSQGKVQVDLLRAAGYLFANHTGSRLFYQIRDEQGTWLAGATDLPSIHRQDPQQVKFFALVRFDDGQYQQQAVRLAELTHVLDTHTPANSPPPPLLKITVAETMETRQQLIQHILWDTLTSQGLLLLASAALVWWGVERGMRPLERFRQGLASKADDDHTPIELPGLPRELRPLIDTLNSYLDRLGRLIEIRKRFLENAAHQLRTPLTALKTQLALAQRNTNPDQAIALLAAAQQTTNGAVHLTEQLLAMTRVEHARELHSHETLDLVALAESATQEHLVRAHQRGDDLGFEALCPHSPVTGVALLLHEALTNLIDNAMHHGGPGVRITVRVGPGWVEVEDNGPGIPPEHQAHVFERFYRAAGQGRSGSGLGLAIVKEIASQHGAKVAINSPCHTQTGGGGTAIRISWP
ncbi:MAG: Sensor protein QseC [Pseudomonadota bacterium]|jgi:two-component system sensor histidine kinase TctE